MSLVITNDFIIILDTKYLEKKQILTFRLINWKLIDILKEKMKYDRGAMKLDSYEILLGFQILAQ